MSYFNRPRRGRNDDFDIDIPEIDVEQEIKNMRGRLPVLVIAAIIVALLFLLQAMPVFYTDLQWFRSLGQGSVFVTRITARLAIFALAAVVFFVLYMINVLIARRLSPPGASSSRAVLVLATVAGLALSFFVGLIAQTQWEMILRYLNATPFGMSDPVFNQEISFYVFTLPMYSFVQSLLSISTVVIALAVAAIYALALGRFRLTSGVKAHLSGLGALFLLLYAANYQLSIYKLVYSTRGVVTGASYTDVHAQWPAFTLLTWITVLAALILLANVVLRATRALAVTAGAWIVVTLLLGQVYPNFVQNFQVKPNELNRETPYIQYNIALTRHAYGLDTVARSPYPGEGAPSTADINLNADTIENIRLWDYRPLLDTYDQLQSIRPYYDFRDIDVDRYMINGKYRQVMLSAREMSQSRLPSQAQTWINRKLVYTHGYGVAMSPVNEIAPDGSPNFFVKNIPPVGDVKIDRPGIYFGERMDGYVIVKTRALEFDYPLGDQNATTRYEGLDGVNVGGMLNRLLFAIRFGDTNILLSNDIHSESRVLMQRNIQDRIRILAPFLALDRDPYIVIADGKLIWLQDAYTLTDNYPFSEAQQAGYNYIRNSVKVAVDAYDGTVTFYIADETDPLIKAWQGIFPSLFTPMSQMPESLRSHLRYPEDMFRVQADVLRTYHMEGAEVFYNKEDLWAMPREIYAEQEQDMEPYYAIMRLPDGQREEFILLLPFTPNNKQNMVAWLGAKSDGEDYGKRVLYEMPKDKLVFGPLQVEARVSQDTEISAQLTLWSQSGSKVLRGNLLIIPIEKSFLYVEPLYLLAEQGQIPQLKRVIVTTATAVAMDENLPLALRKLFSGLALPGATPPAGTTPSTSVTPSAPVSTDVAALIRQANQQYLQAQEALKAGDWTKYGEAQKALEATLKRLAELAR
jgi:hypothetical protein